MHGSALELALVFLLAAVVAVPVFKRFGMSAILGYLAAGVLLGPHALKLVRDPERVLAASEIGVVMLLFIIGLELSLPRLRLMRREILGVGGLQVLLSGVLLALAMLLLVDGWKVALVVGFGLALSSTAVGLQLMSERQELHSPHGRLGFAILLFQDLFAIPLLAAIPLLGKAVNPEFDASLGLAAAKALGMIALLVLLGRPLLRRVFHVVARTGMREVFTATALLVVLGSAWLMQQVGLSAGLGAFLAGVLLAESEYRHEIEAQIQPFEGLLLGLFFMAVGMSIDLAQVAEHPWMVAAGVIVLLGLKGLVLLLVGLRPGRLDRRGALQLAAYLALGGEFAFVVFAEAARARLLDAGMHDRLSAIVGLSMAFTPFLLLGLSRLLPEPGEAQAEAPKRAFDAIPESHPQVLVVGFGRFGQVVARLLLANHTPFVAIDNDIEQIEFMRRFGSKLYYGDPTQPALLRAAAGTGIKAFVVAIDNVELTLRVVRLIRRLYPQATIFARAHDRQHAWKLMDLGVHAVREAYASSLEMGRDVLVELGLPAHVAEDRMRRFRAHDERLLAAQHLIHDDEDALLRSTHDARSELRELFAADAGEGALGEVARRQEEPPAG